MEGGSGVTGSLLVSPLRHLLGAGGGERAGVIRFPSQQQVCLGVWGPNAPSLPPTPLSSALPGCLLTPPPPPLSPTVQPLQGALEGEGSVVLLSLIFHTGGRWPGQDPRCPDQVRPVLRGQFSGGPAPSAVLPSSAESFGVRQPHAGWSPPLPLPGWICPESS